MKLHRIALSVCLLAVTLPAWVKAEVSNRDASEKQTIAQANALVRAGNIQQAESLLQSATEANPASASLHEALGELFFEQRKFEDSVRELTLALQIDPDSRQYTILLATALINWTHFGVAVDLLNAAQKRFGEYPEIHYYRGVAYFNMNRIDEAESDLEQTLHLAPNFDRAQFLLANCRSSQGKDDEALAIYRDLVKQRPSNAIYWATLAKTLQKLGDQYNSEALRAGRRAIALAPSNTLALFTTATVLSQMGNFVAAQPLLEKLTRLDPAAVAPHVLLARVYTRLGKRELARRQTEIIDRLQTQPPR
jgi:predicted Zn-dependent protease